MTVLWFRGNGTAMNSSERLTHLGLFVIDEDTGAPITRHPIYAEVMVPRLRTDTEVEGWLVEAFTGALNDVAPDSDRQVRDRVRRVVGRSILNGLRPASVERIRGDFQLATEFIRKVLLTVVERAGARSLEDIAEKQLGELADDVVVELAPGFNLEPVDARPEPGTLWASPLGVLWSDHSGYVSFDLTRLPAQVREVFDGVTRRRRDGAVAEEEPTIRALAYGATAWVDVLAQGRFTRNAVVARMTLPTDAPRLTGFDHGGAAMQNPSLADWHLSPSSFAANPSRLVGDGGCEQLYPASLALHEFVVRQVVRLSDDPPGITIPDPYRAGYIDEYKVTWTALGHSLGEILYSLPLAPGESVKLAVIDWSRDTLARRDETTKLTEDILHQTHRDRTITETMQAGLREMQHGSSFMGGVAHSGGASVGASLNMIGIGGAAGDAWSLGGSTASSDGSRDLTAENVQRLSDNFSQASAASREINSTVVVQARQEEHESIQTRTFTNYNHAHTLTVLYYEVLRHFRLSVEWVRRRPAVLVRYPATVTKFEESDLLKRQSVLEPVLLDASLVGGFAALNKKDTVSRHQVLHGIQPDALDKPVPQFWEGDLHFALFEFGIKTAEGLRDKTDELAMVNLIILDAGELVHRPLLSMWEKGASTHSLNVGERLNDTAMGWFIAKPEAPVPWHELVGFEFVLHDDDEWRMDRIAINAFHPGGAVQLLDNADVDYYFPKNGGSNTVTFIRRPGARPADGAPTWSPAKSLSPEEYQLAERLVEHVNANLAYYNRALMLATSRAEVSDAFESMPWADGKTVADIATPTPMEVFGSYVAYPLTGERMSADEPPAEARSERLVTMPTRGVFGEGKLGHCTVAEEIDNTRFWKWEEHPIPIQAPDIAAVTPVMPEPQEPDATPTAFPQPMVNIVAPTAAPDPVGLTAALSLLGTPGIFRDMSGQAEVADLLKKLSDNTISIAEAATKAREIQAKQGGGSASGDDGARPATGLGSPRTAPSDRPSTTNQDLHDLQHLLGSAQDKKLITPEAAEQTFTKAAQGAYDPDLILASNRQSTLRTVVVAAATDPQLAQAASVVFFDSSDVDNYFRDVTGQTFAGWFTSILAGRGSWGPLSMSMDADTLTRFAEIWDAFPPILGTDHGTGTNGVTLPEFATLMAKFLHETGSRLLFRGAESVGGYGHPGLSYAFDSFTIQRPGERPFTKGSYNTGNGNHTAYNCFHDPIYLGAFGALQPTAQTIRDRDEWKGTTWPTGVPTTLDGSTAFIQEADFYKFRGRGAIQSTGRVAYLPIVDFVRGYAGTDARITSVKQRWETQATALAAQGITLSSNDDFATVSTNADWDALFATVTIQAAAIRGHNAIPGKQYLPMSTNPRVLRGTHRGSAYFVATAIAGNNPAYGSDVRSRMLEFIGTLWNTPMPASPGAIDL